MKFSISVIGLLLACVLVLVLTCEAGSDWRTSFVPMDPWRAIGGQTNFVKANGVQFCGQIVDVTTQGVRIEGQWGQLGTVYYPVNGWVNNPLPPQYPDFFITNYPYKAINGGRIASAARLMAWYAGTDTYKTAKGESLTIPKLDYGVPCDPNPALFAASQQAKDARRKTESRTVVFLERDATNGDSSAQYSLGIHYLYGIGCETNEVAAIFWLMKAAQQGNTVASNDLQEIEGISLSTNQTVEALNR